MLIFWRQRLVVLATPKTGSTSLEAALGSMADVAVLRPPALRHSTAASARAKLLPYLEAEAGAPFRLVAVMREPLDWLASWYRARVRETFDDGTPEGGGDHGLPELASFEAFLEANLGDRPTGPAAVGSQAAFLCGATGDAEVDRLFRYETFDDFTHFLETELDCELLLPRLNSSPARDLSLPPATLSRFRAARTADYALYSRI